MIKEPADNENRDSSPTFVIKILGHQNATWQGQIHWLEGDQKQSFRSTLELIALMDQAINSGK